MQKLKTPSWKIDTLNPLLEIPLKHLNSHRHNMVVSRLQTQTMSDIENQHWVSVYIWRPLKKSIFFIIGSTLLIISWYTEKVKYDDLEAQRANNLGAISEYRQAAYATQLASLKLDIAEANVHRDSTTFNLEMLIPAYQSLASSYISVIVSSQIMIGITSVLDLDSVHAMEHRSYEHLANQSNLTALKIECSNLLKQAKEDQKSAESSIAVVMKELNEQRHSSHTLFIWMYAIGIILVWVDKGLASFLQIKHRNHINHQVANALKTITSSNPQSTQQSPDSGRLGKPGATGKGSNRGGQN